MGHETLATTVEPVTLTRLLVEWRPDALVLVLLGPLLATYVAAVRSVRAAGGRWPRWRRVMFAGGASTALVALCGGLATYAPAQFSAQLGLSDQLLAGRWFVELNWSWVDPVAGQRLGALLVAATTAVVVLLLALSLALRPRRSGPRVQVADR
jgi:hypothetical protein